LTQINVLGGNQLNFVPLPDQGIAMPVENVIVLVIILVAMVGFTLVTAWSSPDRKKLPRDN